MSISRFKILWKGWLPQHYRYSFAYVYTLDYSSACSGFKACSYSFSISSAVELRVLEREPSVMFSCHIARDIFKYRIVLMS